ncbi:GIY-YIG nuclease family protein [Brachyspira murdochii]|uniref:Excinuclease ABC C subunit domain protein n=2 Tax=Brachyspira murdochii TaxID=84378 RepID=D5U586_BRAM5|nr:GIY-YIG nuclease family protein [Brachyspira murdochii]ADG70353.1 Excinuclease ABC C subunit domain protein [Brachyspira murdochii DSM 12563]PPS20962.1 endonuclease III [Brachyspira murdochii]
MKENNNYWYVYIILCEDNCYYTGITNDLINRFTKHKNGKGANYTRSHKPLKFLSAWEVDSVNIALSIEHYIKSVNKKIKVLFAENNRLLKQYYINDIKTKGKKDYRSISIRSVNKKKLDIINAMSNK